MDQDEEMVKNQQETGKKLVKNQPMSGVREGAEPTELEKEYLEKWEKLSDDEKAKYKSKKMETAFARCKLPVPYIEKLEEQYGSKCKGIRAAVEDHVAKTSPPKGTLEQRAYEAMSSEIPEGEGWPYNELLLWLAKKLGKEDSETQPVLISLINQGYVKNVGGKMVWLREKTVPGAEFLKAILAPSPGEAKLVKELEDAYKIIDYLQEGRKQPPKGEDEYGGG